MLMIWNSQSHFVLLLLYCILGMISTSKHLSRTGCLCHSPCASYGFRPHLSCQVDLESCSNRSTVWIEPEFSQSPSFSTPTEYLSEQPKPLDGISRDTKLINAFFTPDQINNIYNLVNSLISVFKKPPYLSSAPPRTLGRTNSLHSQKKCECKEDFLGIWDYCTMVADDIVDSQVESAPSSLDKPNEEMSWSQSTQHSPPPVNDTLSLFKDHTLHQNIKSEGCHPGCSKCLTHLKNVEYACLECKNLPSQSYILVPIASNVSHGICLPVTQSRIHCHESCHSCLALDPLQSPMSCVSCFLNFRLIPAYVGKCVSDTLLFNLPNQKNDSPWIQPQTAYVHEKQHTTRSSRDTPSQRHFPNHTNTELLRADASSFNFQPDITNRDTSPESISSLNTLAPTWNSQSIVSGKITPFSLSHPNSSLRKSNKTRDVHPETLTRHITKPIKTILSPKRNECLADSHQSNQFQSSCVTNHSTSGQNEEKESWSKYQQKKIKQQAEEDSSSQPPQHREAGQSSKPKAPEHKKFSKTKTLVVSVADPEYCKGVEHYIHRPLSTGDFFDSHKPRGEMAAKRYWTQLVYLQADSNIQSSALNNLYEIVHPVDQDSTTSGPNEWRPSDFMHLVVLLDTRQQSSDEEDEFIFVQRSSHNNHSGNFLENDMTSSNDSTDTKQFFFRGFSWGSYKSDPLLTRLIESFVVCPHLSVTDDVSHHNIDQTRGEAYELYRIRHYDTQKKKFFNEYRWLLLRRRGEVDMNDPYILSDFITRSLRLFPSRYTSLIFWNHGAAWRGLGDDKDNADGEGMSLEAISSGIKKGLTGIDGSENHQVLSLIGFDACTMSEFTVVQQLSDYCQYFLASENYEPARGWNWRYLNPTVKRGKGYPFSNYRAATPLEYATYFIRGYMNLNHVHPQAMDFSNQKAFTLSLIEISAFQRFSREFHTIFQLLYACGGHRISQSIRHVMNDLTLLEACIQQKLCGCVDLGEFLTGLIQNLLMEGFDRRLVSELVKTRDLYYKMIPVDMQHEQKNIAKSLLGFWSSTGSFSSTMNLKKQNLFTGLAIYYPFPDHRCSNSTESRLTSIYYQHLFNTSWSQILTWITTNRQGKECVAHYPPPSLPFVASNPSFKMFPLADGFTGTGRSMDVSLVNISVSSSGYIVPKFSVDFSVSISGYFLLVRALTGVFLDRVPGHFTNAHNDYQRTILLTREIPYSKKKLPLHSSSFTSNHIQASWDLHHFVLVQDDILQDVFPHDSQWVTKNRLRVAPLYVSHAHHLVMKIFNANETNKGEAFQNVSSETIVKDALLGYVKYYNSLENIKRNRYDFGCIMFKWPPLKAFLPKLLVRRKNGWTLLSFTKTEGFIRPILYLTRTWNDLRIVRTSHGRLMTGVIAPQHVISDAVDSNMVFKLGNMETKQGLKIEKWDHSTFLRHLVFPYKTHEFTHLRNLYRGIVGVSVRSMNQTKVDFFLFSIPDLRQEGFPFCVGSNETNHLPSRTNNGVCDILLGKNECSLSQKRNEFEFSTLDDTSDRMFSLSLKQRQEKAGETIFESEQNDCWIQKKGGWLVPLINDVSPKYPTGSRSTDNASQDEHQCRRCGKNTRCVESFSVVGAESEYTCVCEDGYRMRTDQDRSLSPKDQHKTLDCIDINECTEEGIEDVCDKHSICVNLPGSYACVCDSGYVQNDVTLCIQENSCLGMTEEGECICPPGYHRQGPEYLTGERNGRHRESFYDVKNHSAPSSEGLDIFNSHTLPFSNANPFQKSFKDPQQKSSCEDINECELGIASCHPFAECYNLRGGYACLCRDDYEGDGHICLRRPPSVTIALRLYSVDRFIEDALLLNSDNRSSEKEMESFFATGFSQALGISQWRVTVVEPLAVLQEDHHSNTSAHQTTMQHINTSYTPKVYRCVIRFLSFPYHLEQHNTPLGEIFGHERDSHNFFQELSSYQIVVELKRQLETQFYYSHQNITSTYSYARIYPIQNPKIVGEKFAKMARNMLLDAYRIDESLNLSPDENFLSILRSYFENYVKRIKKTWIKLPEAGKLSLVGILFIVMVLLGYYTIAQCYSFFSTTKRKVSKVSD